MRQSAFHEAQSGIGAVDDSEHSVMSLTRLVQQRCDASVHLIRSHGSSPLF
jgi:hypothetical protein